MYKCNMLCDHCPHDKECDHIPLEERRVQEVMMCGKVLTVLLLLIGVLLIIGFIFGR